MSVKGSGKQYTFDGFTGNLTQWSERLGVPSTTLFYRLKKFGKSGDALKMVFKSESNRWMRAAKFIEWNGERHCMMDWAKKFGIPVDAFRQRITRYGYTFEEAVRKQPKYGHGGLENWTKKFGGKRLVIDGVEDNIAGHARRHGKTYVMVKDRLRSGWKLEDAILTSKVRDRSPYIKASIRRRELAAMGIIA